STFGERGQLSINIFPFWSSLKSGRLFSRINRFASVVTFVCSEFRTKPWRLILLTGVGIDFAHNFPERIPGSSPWTTPRTGWKTMEAVLNAFLLSTDPQSLFVVKHTFDRYAIRTTHCGTCSTASDMLKQKKFDLFVLDLDLRGMEELLSSPALNCLTRTSNIIALAATSSSLSDALCRRARYVLDKPLSGDAMAGTLQNLYRLIFLEKRAYFRCAVRINATASYQLNIIRQPLENAVLLDLSQNGLCLNTREALPQGAKAFVDFELPGTHD